jgi:hypothetical protein
LKGYFNSIACARFQDKISMSVDQSEIKNLMDQIDAVKLDNEKLQARVESIDGAEASVPHNGNQTSVPHELPCTSLNCGVCANCASCEVTNSQKIAIKATPAAAWAYLSDVRNLQVVHEPVKRVEVLEDTATSTMRIVRWIQHSDWGRRKKQEEVLTAAVFQPETNSGYIDNVSVKRIDPSAEIMHFAHRFSIDPVGSDSCTLSESELLQSHHAQLSACQKNTANFHVLLFTNIKRELEAAA